jgi:hypothetical protein
MILRNIHTGEFIIAPDGTYEVKDAYIIPLQCLYKTDYEEVEYDPNKKFVIEEKNNE